MLDQSLLACPAELPLHGPEVLRRFGKTLVVAPHPDDESLGCGGTMALLRQMNLEVGVLFVSDGSMSHPNSRRCPAPALRSLREQEALAALAKLGVPAEAATFLRLKDTAVPTTSTPDFPAAVQQCRVLLQAFEPATILVCWRRDPHSDHRATFQLVQAAINGMLPRPRLLEYPVWVWATTAPEDAPQAAEALAWRIDISSVMEQKQAAIAAHRSQLTDLIDDDPEGFRLTPEMLAHFAHDWELFLEELVP